MRKLDNPNFEHKSLDQALKEFEKLDDIPVKIKKIKTYFITSITHYQVPLFLLL